MDVPPERRQSDMWRGSAIPFTRFIFLRDTIPAAYGSCVENTTIREDHCPTQMQNVANVKDSLIYD